MADEMIVESYYRGRLDEVGRHAFDALTDGLMMWSQTKDAYPHWPELLECCRAYVDRIKALPFAGRITLAKVMAEGGVLLKQRHGLNAPRCWYKIVKQLREEKDRRCLYI